MIIEKRKCAYCEKEFVPQPSQISSGVGKFCSHTCAGLARKFPTYLEILSIHTDKSLGESECWIYNVMPASGGYRQIEVNGKTVQVHRLVYELCCGPIPEGFDVHHICRNRGCVNPKHLELLNHKKHTAGERNAMCKLTSEKVKEIRSLYKTGEISQRGLAKKYGVSQGKIWQVVTNRVWRDEE
jgi:hypothetical protein